MQEIFFGGAAVKTLLKFSVTFPVFWEGQCKSVRFFNTTGISSTPAYRSILLIRYPTKTL